MKGNGRNRIWMILAISCLFVMLPCAGHAADLTIGNAILANGIYGAPVGTGSPVYVNSSGQLGTVASSGTNTVNCSAIPPQSLQSAIDAAQIGDTINVTGTCNENLLISDQKTRITLQGQSGAILNGPSATSNVLNIRGRGISIQNFEITGGSSGIWVNRGSTAMINGNNIHNTGATGIIIEHVSFAIITNNNIHDNPQLGIAVIENSHARIGFAGTNDTSASPNTIQNNGNRGIEINRASSARIVGNLITGNSLDGIGVVRLSQADIADNTINDNLNGIYVRDNSSVQIGEDNPGTNFIGQPNHTTVNNAQWGIICTMGGSVRGHFGASNSNQINGDSGQSSIDGICPSDMKTP